MPILTQLPDCHFDNPPLTTPELYSIAMQIPGIFSVVLACMFLVCYGAKQNIKIDISEGIKNPDPAGANPVMAEYNTGDKMFQGDIFIRDGKKDEALKRNAHSDPNKLWPQGTVPYELSPEVNTPERIEKLNAAIADYNEFTCIKFVPRNGEEDFVKITSEEGGCFAEPGRMGGEQQLNLEDGCWRTKGTVIHEMLHALGFEHEHARNDRDEYVTIHWNNIFEDFKFNFEKMAAENNQGFGYDYLSVLHYNAYAFTPDYKTRSITTKQKEFQDKIGQRAGFSDQDIEEVKKLYQCQGKTSNVPGVNGCLNKEDYKNYCKFNDEEHLLRRCGDPGVRAYCKKLCTKCDQPGPPAIDYGTKTCFDKNAYFCREELGLKNGVDEHVCQSQGDYCRHSCKKC